MSRNVPVEPPRAQVPDGEGRGASRWSDLLDVTFSTAAAAIVVGASVRTRRNFFRPRHLHGGMRPLTAALRALDHPPVPRTPR